MKILQIVPALGSGGAEHFVFELSNELSRQGHQVEILTLYEVSSDNYLINNLDSKINVNSLFKKNGFDPRLFYSVWRYICRGKFDVVHSHVGAIKYMTLASFLCKKVRFVATIHSEASREAGKSIDKWTRKLMFRLRTCIPVTISEESELSFEAFYGRRGNMIMNGVSNYSKKEDINLHDNENQIVFLHPASCQQVKNQILLFSAFNKLLDAGYDARIVWVGSNKKYRTLYESLRPLMKRNIDFLGVVDNVRDYMRASDAVCLSSRMEGMPMTIIEAFSVATPVLCTPVGGCINMVKQGENGLMSEDLTEESYFHMLESFVKLSSDDRKRMSEVALSSFADYNIANCVNQYIRVYGDNE